MIGYYSYTVILTYLSLGSACVGIGFAASGNPFYAIICLLLSGFFDLFDGKVARTKKNRTDDEMKFGVQIDSLSDLIAFGVLPGFIGYSIGLTEWGLIFIALYVLAALIRLAYFNVLEDKRMQVETGKRKSFVGLPVTSAALIFPLVYIFKEDLQGAFEYVYLGVLIVVGLLFVLKINVKKPGLKMAIGMIAFGAIMIAILLLRKFVF